jgi:hypothetical protein
MTDQADRQLERSPDTGTAAPRRAPEADSEAVSRQAGDYRDGLRSRRWQAAPLKNPEVEKTDPRIAVLAIVLMGAITLVVLVLGYGILDIWSLPA